MREQDFSNIRYFTKDEIERTGAKIIDVKYETIRKLDDFRKEIGCGVRLLHNGITTGEHKSLQHGDGKAVDFALINIRHGVDVVNAGLKSGFRRFGIYWNTISNSYHFDLGPIYGFWSGTKISGEDWKYGQLIFDPRELT